MIKTLIFSLSFVALCAYSKSTVFDFKDPKGVNSILFHLDAPLESISGSGNDLTGSVSFDPENESKWRDQVEFISLHVGNPVLKEHMHGDDWLQVNKFPEIFSFSSLSKVKKDGNSLSVKQMVR